MAVSLSGGACKGHIRHKSLQRHICYTMQGLLRGALHVVTDTSHAVAETHLLHVHRHICSKSLAGGGYMWMAEQLGRWRHSSLHSSNVSTCQCARADLVIGGHRGLAVVHTVVHTSSSTHKTATQRCVYTQCMHTQREREREREKRDQAL